MCVCVCVGGGGGGGSGGRGDSLSPPSLNIFTVGNMRVMICLGQRGLHSLSASNCKMGPFSALVCIYLEQLSRILGKTVLFLTMPCEGNELPC